MKGEKQRIAGICLMVVTACDVRNAAWQGRKRDAGPLRRGFGEDN